MINEINAIIMQFSSCFSRTAAFKWFVISIMGFIVRLDFHGVSSFTRWLSLDPKSYEAFLCFFRTSSWDLSQIQRCWVSIIKRHCSPLSVNGHILAVGDTVKAAKEAHKMPAVKKLHQDSENSSKASFIFGHHFGAIGLLIGNISNLFCIPVMFELHEGVKELRSFQGKTAPVLDEKESVTVITLMTAMATKLTECFDQPLMLVLDAYYSSRSNYILARECVNTTGQRLMHIITRAKSNFVGYEDPCPRTGKPGRPPTYGKKITLNEQFKLRANDFQSVPLCLYGKDVTATILCLDLIWKPIKEKIRFVLVKIDNDCFVLMCSNLRWSPEDIITAYSYRFKIEVTFKNLKQLLGSFCYHFWSKVTPKLNKKTSIDLTCITDNSQKQLIAKTVNAIEAFVNFAGIALGILQILAVNYPQSIWNNYTGWLRTKRTNVLSEETVRLVIQEIFYHNFSVFKNTAIYEIIMAKKRKRLHLYADNVA